MLVDQKVTRECYVASLRMESTDRMLKHVAKTRGEMNFVHKILQRLKV